MNEPLEETRLTIQVQQELHICPACGTSNALESLSKHEYRCGQCNLELAHLDFAANGVVRGIFGWLHTDGDMIKDRYRVKSVLGRGGFGATYLVEDTRLNGKRRALKEVPELLFDEYETTLLSQLNHPAIPDIIDRSVIDGMVYLVLEFGGSRTLGGERKQYQGRIPQTKLLSWMHQLCDVLIYLHSQNPPIIHRDLKPDNILLDENGRIMLIDFGIAKEAKPATMTRTIGRAATHGFSPPEQAMGTGTDERSDIYALAATFYALLTGESPPAAHERVAGKEIIPPSQIVPDMSPQLETAILKALNLNVNHRQQTMKEFSQSLEAIALSTHDFMPHTAEYTERTVMINRTIGVTDSTEIHPPSIKLPRGQISIEKSTPSLAAVTSQQVSKRNVILLLSGIVIVFAVLLTAYLFWSEKKETETGIGISIVNPAFEKRKTEESTATPTRETPSAEEAKTKGETIKPTEKTPTGGSTIEIKKHQETATSTLSDAMKKQGNPNEMDDEAVDLPPPVQDGNAGHKGDGNAGHKGDGNAGHKGDGNAGHKGDGNAGHKGDGNAGRKGDGNAGHKGDGNAGRKGDGNVGHKGDGNAGRKGDGNAGRKGDGNPPPNQTDWPDPIYRK